MGKNKNKTQIRKKLNSKAFCEVNAGGDGEAHGGETPSLSHVPSPGVVYQHMQDFKHRFTSSPPDEAANS